MADVEFMPQTILETEDEHEAQEAPQGLTPDTLQAILAENRRANEAMVRNAVGQRPLQQDSVAPELKLSLEGLPDPATHPREHSVALAKRAEETFGAALARSTQAVEQRVARQIADKDVIARANAMIMAANPNLTDAVVGFASQQVIAQMRAEGIQDVMGELRRDTEGVCQRVLDYTDDMAAQLTGGQRPARVPNGETDGRTRGLVAPRTRSAARPRASADAEDGRQMFKELTSLQSKARIY